MKHFHLQFSHINVESKVNRFKKFQQLQYLQYKRKYEIELIKVIAHKMLNRLDLKTYRV